MDVMRWDATAEEIRGEAHGLGFTDDELVMPPMDELVAWFLSLPLSWQTQPPCYRRSGYEVHVQPSCRCRRRRLR